MKRFIAILALGLLFLASGALAQQPAYGIRSGTSDPAQCQPASTNIFVNRTSGLLKLCTATNVWTAAALAGSAPYLPGLKGQTAAPGAPTAALAGAGAGNVENGAHIYKVTFTTAGGETTPGTASATVTVTDKTADGKVALSAIPTGNALVTSRKVYRTLAGGSTYKLLTTLADNTTTTYTDNVADASLTTTAPTANTAIDTYVTLANNLVTVPELSVSGGNSSGQCTLNGGATATCTHTVPGGCIPVCTYSSSSIPHIVSCAVSSTTLTAVSATTLDGGVINYHCF